MDMSVKTRRSHKQQGIKRRELYEPKDVEIGYEFILRLVSLRIAEEMPRPSTKEERALRFKKAKNIIAQQMGYDSYVALPKGAKAFESRCASVRKQFPHLAYSDIADKERAVNKKFCDDLYESIMEELDYYAQEIRFSAEDRRWNLVRRMCCYTIPFAFKP